MIDSVPTNVLQNCTIEVINRYPKLANENVTNIASYNRSNVVDILSDTFVKFSDVYTDTTSQLYFKWVNHISNLKSLLEIQKFGKISRVRKKEIKEQI